MFKTSDIRREFFRSTSKVYCNTQAGSECVTRDMADRSESTSRIPAIETRLDNVILRKKAD